MNVGARNRAVRWSSEGFTLIELMIVISIALLVLGWGVPTMMSTLEKHGISKAAGDIMDACDQARAFAILKGVPAEVVIRAEDGQIRIRGAMHEALMSATIDDLDGAVGKENRETTDGEGFIRYLDRDVAVEMIEVNFKDQKEFPEAVARFYSNGTCDEFTVVIRLDDEYRIVSLDPITGIAAMDDVRNLKDMMR